MFQVRYLGEKQCKLVKKENLALFRMVQATLSHQLSAVRKGPSLFIIPASRFQVSVQQNLSRLAVYILGANLFKVGTKGVVTSPILLSWCKSRRSRQKQSVLACFYLSSLLLTYHSLSPKKYLGVLCLIKTLEKILLKVNMGNKGLPPKSAYLTLLRLILDSQSAQLDLVR